MRDILVPKLCLGTRLFRNFVSPPRNSNPAPRIPCVSSSAAKLESELSIKLGVAVDEALAALDRQPFHQRIRTELTRKI
jgi:hypothetical protein